MKNSSLIRVSARTKKKLKQQSLDSGLPMSTILDLWARKHKKVFDDDEEDFFKF